MTRQCHRGVNPKVWPQRKRQIHEASGGGSVPPWPKPRRPLSPAVQGSAGARISEDWGCTGRGVVLGFQFFFL